MSAVTRVRRYRRSPFLVLLWSDNELTLLNSNTLQRFRVRLEMLAFLSQLSEWSSADLSITGHSIGDDDLEELHQMGLLEAEDEVGSAQAGEFKSRPDTLFLWDPIELAVQRRTALGGHWPQQTPACPSPRFRKDLPDGPVTGLPQPVPVLRGCLSDVLNRRRTMRTYLERPLSLEELSTLLYHSARIVRTFAHPDLGELALRPFPTAGARSELEIYVVSEHIAGLDAGAYYYDPYDHRLVKVRERDDRQARLLRSVNDATGGALSRDPPAVLLITAVFERVMWKYRDLGLSLIYKDTGCLLQTLYLVATALGLAPCAIGGGDEVENSRWLGLDPLHESQVGCFLIGPQAPPSGMES
jgi:SagB-type dehydrogenase family enzyme